MGKYLVKLYDTGMAYQFEYMYLARHTLDISHINNLLLDQDLDCYFLACQCVGSKLDLAESALTDCLAQHVVADLFLFIDTVTHLV